MSELESDKLSVFQLKTHERLLSIEEYIKDGKVLRSQLNDTMQEIGLRTKNVELMIHGDPNKPDKYARDGINRRLEAVEIREKEIDSAKKNFLNVAVGSITLAVGAFVVWMFKLVASHLPK